MSIFKPREAERSFLLAVVMMTAKMLFFVVLLLGLSCTGLVVGVAKAWIDTSPELDLDQLYSQSQTSFIYDKHGNLITEFKGSENRINASIEEMPQNLIDAVIAIEDARFYEHEGVDVKRIAGALLSNVTSGTMQGASTITCQLVKLTLLSSDQNYKRKIQEAYLALQLEDALTKDEILEEYLNVIYLGGSNYGVKIAAKDYFGKELSELTLRECATLAGIIRNPSRRNPRLNYYKRGTPDETDDRTDHVLNQMLKYGYITEEECNAAKAEQLVVLETSTAAADAMYDNAYYVEYAIYDVVTKMLRVEELEDTSSNRSAMETKLRNGGYHIYTCLDPELQQAVQEVVTEWNGYPKMRYSNDSVKEASLGGGETIEVVQPQAAAVVMDWHTGELVAVVGGRSEPVQKKQMNRAYMMDMPVGSSIKPIAVYGPAFDLGFSPGTPVLNLPIPIEGWHSENGYPQNYGGGGYSTGVESMRVAINKSHNTSTAHALLDYVGIENSVTYLLKLGVSPDSIMANGSGLALGSSGITPVEMTAAFGAIANLGQYQEPYAFTKVLNSDGSTYIDVTQVQITRQAFKPSTAWLLVDVLKGCIDGTGSRARFGGMTVAGKTGTNSNNIGVFFSGLTPYYSGSVWVGSDYYDPLITSATGGTYAAPLWSAVMKKVHQVTGNTQDRDIITKSASSLGLVKASSCAVSGMKPTKACKNSAHGVTTDYYLAGTEPTQECNMHRADGSIYIPSGHPLREAESLNDVRKYFKKATYDE